MTTTVAQTTQVYQVFIKASAEEIWQAITKPEWTARYFHGARITVTPDHYDSRGPDGDVWGDNDVEVFDPPRKLVHGWRSMYDPELAAEDESRVTWEIEETRPPASASSRSSTIGSRVRPRRQRASPGPAGPA
jgi:uncharacterized protein YndB with AHSA1/START domain